MEEAGQREYREAFRIREYLHLEGYDKRVMASLIESAKVMGEDRLEVVWKFGDVTEIEKFQDDIQIKEIWKNLVGIRDCFTENKIVIWDYYAHNDFINKMGLLVGVDVLKYKDESDKIISRDFSIAKK